jgi:crossover junction endodeoxyribonuclease RuvC
MTFARAPPHSNGLCFISHFFHQPPANIGETSHCRVTFAANACMFFGRCLSSMAAIPMTVLGVDIGSAGALALLTEAGELIDVADMPILRDGPSKRPAVNGPLLAELVGRWRPDRAIIEYVGARPGEGAVGAFAFGRSRGVCEGVLAAFSISATTIAPAAWKRAVGIAPGKDGRRMLRGRRQSGVGP